MISKFFSIFWCVAFLVLKNAFLRSEWKNDIKGAVDYHNSEMNISIYFQKALML